MGIRISIIVPIYNAESTLRAAVASILAQEIPEMELLLVDDGSTDGTAAICHELSQQDPRVRVITQKNSGICAARNRGLSAATGEYIGFCDDDDMWLPGALKMLLEEAATGVFDVVRGGYELLREEKGKGLCPQPHDAGMACDLWVVGYADFLQNSGPQFVWNALYRREILKGIQFDERCRYGLEDFIFNMAVYARTDKVRYLPLPVYRHFEGAQSTSVCQSSKAMRGRIHALEPWMAAEYAALQQRCPASERDAVWTMRKAEAVTFLMHQLRDANAPAALRRYAWETLRQVLRAYPTNRLDFLRGARQNKKKGIALLLYQLRMQRLYDLLPVTGSKP